MKPQPARMLWEKADAMARKMDDTYNAMESLAGKVRIDAAAAKEAARNAEAEAQYIAIVDQNAAHRAEAVSQYAEKLRTQALQLFLALALANTAVCVGATALTYYLMR